MKRLFLSLVLALPVLAADGDPVFRSDVSLARVDVQVLDRDNRAITGLRKEDFVLREGGQIREIRNFAAEDMPVDLLFLLDVSGSMRPHVERVVRASQEALRLLGEEDRVAIMVFDRVARVRMPFKSNLSEVDREFKRLLDQESFNGGTEITLSLQTAAAYIRKNGRRNARRAIVILTDDETGGARDEAAVLQSLTNAQAVLSALIAPDAMAGRMGTGYPRQGGGRRGVGGGPLGGIIFGGPTIGGGQRGGGYPGSGGGGYPGSGGGRMGSRTHPAGTAEIARQSGGDSLPVDDASALEDTINRIRQRYALHFHADSTKQGTVEVTLADNARRRYADAEIRSRRVYVNQDSGDGADQRPVITRTPRRMPGEVARPEVSQTAEREPTVTRRRPAVSERGGSYGGNPSAATVAPQQEEAAAASTPDTPAVPATPAAAATPAAPKQGGWRVLKPGEKP